ncbi:unnamed protein product [Phytophthora fragariaefolia]|uniref:Unnamed protein product n=1 Tax=Phytophthora fragariaefolia TaxID=1490495 RepID=A0A9W6XN81_9STRA|nr:unnamed protein product [Phytophthora fragariaefolia]
MDGLRVGPARTQLCRVYANTMEEAIQIALQEEYSHRQVRTSATAWQGNSAPGSAEGGCPGNEWACSHGTGSSRAARSPLLWLWKTGTHEACLSSQRTAEAVLREVLRLKGSRAAAVTQVPGKCRRRGALLGEDLSLHDRRVGGTRHGGFAPESLGALESRKRSDRLLVVHGRLRGYEYPFQILIDSGASKNFARRQSVARNADKFADALRENSGAGPVSVRLAKGSLVEVPGVLMDLSVTFEDFDSTERFIVLEMDKYDLILGMTWLEKHEAWIDWRGKAIGLVGPPLLTDLLVSHVPTSVKSKGVHQDRQGASAPEAFMGVAEVFGVPQEVTVDSVMESAEALPGVKPSEPREASRSGWALCPACEATNSVDPDTGSRRVYGLRQIRCCGLHTTRHFTWSWRFL